MTPQVVTTQDLYNGIKSLIGKESPYSVAKYLGASTQTGYNWRDSINVMDDKYGLRAAHALGLDADHVLACLAAERAERAGSAETAAVWRHVALRLATAASVTFLGIYSVLLTINPV